MRIYAKIVCNMNFENGKSCKNRGQKLEKVVKMESVNCDLVSIWAVR